MKKISIITPCFNEELGIEEAYLVVKNVIDNMNGYTYEHIFTDNHSTDRTVDILRKIAKKDKNVKVIVNSRNFGLSRSPYNALMQTTGDVVIPIDADLQSPPEMIPTLVSKWEEGWKMVIAVRKQSKDNLLMKLLRKTYYKIISQISSTEQIQNFTGFGLFDRKIIESLRSLKDPNPYFRGLIAEIGYDKCFVEYTQPARKHGKSKNSMYALFDFAMIGITKNSKLPLRMASLLGFICSLLSLTVALVYLVLKLIYWESFSLGVAPLIVGLFFFISVQLFFLGIAGEYIGTVLDHVRAHPLVQEQERINFE